MEMERRGKQSLILSMSCIAEMTTSALSNIKYWIKKNSSFSNKHNKVKKSKVVRKVS